MKISPNPPPNHGRRPADDDLYPQAVDAQSLVNADYFRRFAPNTMLTLFSLQGAMDIDEGYHLRPWMSVHFCGIAWGIPIAFTCVNIRTGTWFRFDDLLSSTATLLQRFEETGGHAWIFFYFRKARRACRIGARALVDYRFKHRGLGMDLEDMLEIGRAVYTNFNDKVDLYAEEISAASKAALQQQSVGTRQAVWA